MYDIIISGGTVYDGSGAPGRSADIGIAGGSITAVGKLDKAAAARVIDASGKLVTPGFIDMHSHADLSLIQYPDAESLLGQGITTVFCGHCGMGMAPAGRWWKTQGDDVFALEQFAPLSSACNVPGRTPICPTSLMRGAYREYFGVEMDWTSFADYLDRLRGTGIGVNAAALAGYQQIRAQVLGPDSARPAAADEISAMRRLVRESLEGGALGLSIGFDYTPDMSAGPEELEAMAQEVRAHGGILAAHTRNGKDDDPAWTPFDGIREFLELGLRTGVRLHISHIQPGLGPGEATEEQVAGSTRRTLELIEDYRARGVQVSWDVLHPKAAAFYYYPELVSPLIYYVLACGGKEALRARLSDGAYRAYLTAQLEKGAHMVFPRLDYAARITRCAEPAWLGKGVAQLAEEAGTSKEEMLLRVFERDVDTCIRPQLPYERSGGLDLFKYFWQLDEAGIGTDNCAFNYDYEGRGSSLPAYRSTPSAYSGFVTFLLESGAIPFEKTVRKLSANAADILGLTDRGRLAAGKRADVVVLDRARLDANIDYIDPRKPPKGIDYVLVNGRVAVDKGLHTHVRSGELLV